MILVIWYNILRPVKKESNKVFSFFKEIRKLEKLGYVATHINNEDNRSKTVCLTQKGREIKQIFFEISKMLYHIQYKGMTEEQIKAFQEGLELVHRNYKD